MLNYMLWTILISGISNTKGEYCGDDYFPLQQSDKAEYVECQCDHLSIFAAQGESDNRTGYKIYFFIVCFVCMVCYINFYFYFWDGEVSLKKENSGIFLVIFSLENIFNREIVTMLASRNSCFPSRKLKLTSLFFFFLLLGSVFRRLGYPPRMLCREHVCCQAIDSFVFRLYDGSGEQFVLILLIHMIIGAFVYFMQQYK